MLKEYSAPYVKQIVDAVQDENFIVELLKSMPADKPVCGNISPAGKFASGTPEAMYEATRTLIERCTAYPNFVLSSGCDIPPSAKWENIRAFFAAAAEQK